MKRRLFLLCLPVLLSACGTKAPVATVPPPAPATLLSFKTYMQRGMPEQDVFVEQRRGAPLMRAQNDRSPEAMSFMLERSAWTAAAAVPRDPVKTGSDALDGIGKGRSLRMRMDDWLAAVGTGRYEVSGHTGRITAQFQRLVENGKYSLWCGWIARGAKKSLAIDPCGKADGSDSTFQADYDGRGEIDVTGRALLQSNASGSAIIMLVYHSDNVTHGSVPGEFGKNAHTHLTVELPRPGAVRDF